MPGSASSVRRIRSAGELRPVRHADLAGVQREAHADAAAVVEARPTTRRSRCSTSALRIGQSATASEPSRIDSVSRWGEATEPASRWSRPITIGAETSPEATISLKRRPAQVALAVAEPADPRRQPLERDALGRQLDPAPDVLLVAEQLEDRAVGRGDVGRVARQRDPAERALALAEQRPDVGGHEARVLERVLVAVVLRRRRAARCRSRTPRRPRARACGSRRRARARTAPTRSRYSSGSAARSASACSIVSPAGT